MTQTVKNSDLSKVNFNLQFSFLYFKGGFNLGQVFVKFIWKEGFFSFRINTYFASIWENILIHQVLYVEWFPFSLKLSAFKKNVWWMVGRGYFNWILIDLCIQHGNSQQILSFCPFCSNVLSWDRVLKSLSANSSPRNPWAVHCVKIIMTTGNGVSSQIKHCLIKIEWKTKYLLSKTL